MKNYYEQLYLDMLAEIDNNLQLNLPEKEKAEKCFWISRNFARQLKKIINENEFENEEKEINFFRNVKPKFTSYIEYFLLINEALLFVPVQQDAAIAFWELEKDKLRTLQRKYDPFFSYYEGNEHSSDETYFLRKNNDLNYTSDLHIFETDIDWCTSHDRLVRNFLAYKMYSNYCNKKLTELIQTPAKK